MTTSASRRDSSRQRSHSASGSATARSSPTRRRGWMPAHPTFYCRREVVAAVGEFDLRYRVGADYGYMLRALELFDFTAAPCGHVLPDAIPPHA